MIDYILNNKEWIFSGIGVSAIALIFLCFKYFFRQNNPPHRKNIVNSTLNPHEPSSTALSLGKKINELTCEWMQDPPVWKHKTNGLYYCPKCAPNPSPLSSDWYCPKCSTGFGKGEVFTVDW